MRKNIISRNYVVLVKPMPGNSNRLYSERKPIMGTEEQLIKLLIHFGNNSTKYGVPKLVTGTQLINGAIADIYTEDLLHPSTYKDYLPA